MGHPVIQLTERLLPKGTTAPSHRPQRERSIVFTPEYSIPTLRAFYNNYGHGFGQLTDSAMDSISARTGWRETSWGSTRAQS
jgi:hypothetical protein